VAALLAIGGGACSSSAPAPSNGAGTAGVAGTASGAGGASVSSAGTAAGGVNAGAGSGGAESGGASGASTGGGAGASGAVGAAGAGASGASGAGASGAGASSAGASGAGGGAAACDGGQSTSADVVVNLADVQQNISGFGASTAWGSTMSAADADTLWSTTTGAGLSLHRVRIDYQTGQTSELSIAKLAVAHGVKVWATPWTPPAADKAGATGANGEIEGTLSNAPAFATFVAGFVNYMKAEGVNIYAVSAQNEPDATVAYESCSYTGPALASFIGTNLAPALANSGVKIMAPETQNWCGFPTFESALSGNASAWQAASIIATHEYGCDPTAYPEIAKAGKEFWATEMYDTTTSVADPGIPSALRIAKLIHDALTIANMNAWHYWWVYPSAADNGALWDQGTGKPSKRLWVEGNYARFVRPGFHRVGVTGSVPAGVLLSAYTNPLDGTVSVVAINNNPSSTPLSVFVSGAAPCSVTPWVTSASDDLAPKTAVSVSASRFGATLAADSVTTFVGKP
jgi:glucuronoarabinoxylan endo-1,4-beta-xylanase